MRAYDKANGGWSKEQAGRRPTLAWFLDRAKAGIGRFDRVALPDRSDRADRRILGGISQSR